LDGWIDQFEPFRTLHPNHQRDWHHSPCCSLFLRGSRPATWIDSSHWQAKPAHEGKALLNQGQTVKSALQMVHWLCKRTRPRTPQCGSTACHQRRVSIHDLDLDSSLNECKDVGGDNGKSAPVAPVDLAMQQEKLMVMVASEEQTVATRGSIECVCTVRSDSSHPAESQSTCSRDQSWRL
jgi:hypothetical protein